MLARGAARSREIFAALALVLSARRGAGRQLVAGAARDARRPHGRAADGVNR